MHFADFFTYSICICWPNLMLMSFFHINVIVLIFDHKKLMTAVFLSEEFRNPTFSNYCATAEPQCCHPEPSTTVPRVQQIRQKKSRLRKLPQVIHKNFLTEHFRKISYLSNHFVLNKINRHTTAMSWSCLDRTVHGLPQNCGCTQLCLLSRHNLETAGSPMRGVVQ